MAYEKAKEQAEAKEEAEAVAKEEKEAPAPATEEAQEAPPPAAEPEEEIPAEPPDVEPEEEIPAEPPDVEAAEPAVRGEQGVGPEEPAEAKAMEIPGNVKGTMDAEGKNEGTLAEAEGLLRMQLAAERQAVPERRDAKARQEAWPQVMGPVTQAEDAVETVAILATPFGEEDEELGESEKKTVEEIEEAAAGASTALLDARKWPTWGWPERTSVHLRLGRWHCKSLRARKTQSSRQGPS